MTPAEAAAAVVASFLDKALAAALAAVAAYWFGYYKGRATFIACACSDREEGAT